ncbi:hypothetical protein DY000_02029647 [Brassica cretica]|uniref:Alpha/beta hydrolase fold-3 domain-containing protein n=1 Tax=Brassica cretica TaxID=69181 RepID=A0ABQ7DI03_BRACR|nr:hypothetical protein DY000_02029647 [Brassica cretica]
MPAFLATASSPFFLIVFKALVGKRSLTKRLPASHQTFLYYIVAENQTYRDKSYPNNTELAREPYEGGEEFTCDNWLKTTGKGRKGDTTERLSGTEIIPTSLDKTNDIVTKDVLYSPEHNLSVRLFLPHKTTAGKNLPLLIYIHGGAWIIESPFSPIYHNYVTEIVKSANCLAGASGSVIV